MSTVIEFGVLPPNRRGNRAEIDRFVDELQSRPGVWAVNLRTGDYNAARSRAYKVLRRRGCEAVCRTNRDSLVEVWARWPVVD